MADMAVKIKDTQREAERQRFLAEASHLLSSTLDYPETLRRLTRLAVPRIADWCAIYIADQQGELKLAHVAHADPSKVELAMEMRRRFPPDKQETRGAYEVFRTGRSVYVREITDEMLAAEPLHPQHLEMLQELGLRSVMTVPLRARGRMFGVIQFVSAESAHLFNDDDVAFAEDFAVRAAFAADNARLFQAARRRQKEEVALRRATEAVTATFSVEEIIKQIATSALEATDADGSYVEQIMGDVVRVVAVSGTLHPQLGEEVPYRGSVTERVLEIGQPEIVTSLGDCAVPLPGMLAQTHAYARALFVPLVDGGQAIGALILLRSEERDRFTRDEAERAHTFGNLAALAFRKVHLLEDTEHRRVEMEQAVKSRSRLMRGFTHDLKNPIGAADGHAALLEDGLLGNLTDEQLNSIRRIRASLANALKLIDTLNEFARAEAGRLELREAPTQVVEIAREIAEQYRASAEQAQIAIELELNKIPIIVTDDDRVRQILGNLVSNAIKYTDKGGRLCVRTDVRANEAGEESVVLEVEDTGIGVPEDMMHKLFEEFERIDPTVKPGIGLGLAISRRVARALGGELTASSVRGQGSTFTLWLPKRN